MHGSAAIYVFLKGALNFSLPIGLGARDQSWSDGKLCCEGQPVTQCGMNKYAEIPRSDDGRKGIRGGNLVLTVPPFTFYLPLLAMSLGLFYVFDRLERLDTAKTKDDLAPSVNPRNPQSSPSI